MADKKADAGTDRADAMREAGTSVVDAGAQLGIKMLDQAEANTQEAFRAMRAAAQAGDLSAVMRVQADYLREQGSRSVAQAREIGEMIARMGKDAVDKASGRD